MCRSVTVFCCATTHIWRSTASFIPTILWTQQLPKPRHPRHFCQTSSYKHTGCSLGPTGTSDSSAIFLFSE